MHIAADTKLSVNKAAALWGISTTTLNKALDSGKLTRAGDGKLLAAEMIRVYGRIKSAADTTKPKPAVVKKQHASAAHTLTPPPATKARGKTPSAEPAVPAPSSVIQAAAPIAPDLEQQLRLQITALEQQLIEAKAREDWLKAQINELWTEKVELQNAKKGVFGRLLG